MNTGCTDSYSSDTRRTINYSRCWVLVVNAVVKQAKYQVR